MNRLRIGFMPLSDCAVLAVAVEKGFFRRHGVEVTLLREAAHGVLPPRRRCPNRRRHTA